MPAADWAAADWPSLLAELRRQPPSQDAWAEAFRRVRDAVGRAFDRMPDGAEEPEDLAGELMVRLALPESPVAKALGTLSTEGGSRAYLVTVARNALLTRLRRRQVEKRSLGRIAREAHSRAVDSAHPLGADEVEHLGRRLHRLTEPERELLRMRFWEELPLSEIADRAGVSYSAAAVRLHRLIRKLRELL